MTPADADPQPERKTDAPSAPESAEPAGRDGARRCLNCGTALGGPFCHGCGQEVTELAIPLRRLLRDALEDLIALDSRVLRTLGPLLLRPGLLTVEYVRGHRIRYVPPLRLYLFISFILFLFLSFSDYSVVRSEGEADGTFILVRTSEAPDEVDTTDAAREIDEALVEEAEQEEPWIVRRLDAALEDPEAFNRLYVQVLPTLLFLTVPVLGLLVQGLFWRQRRTYVEHVVFSLHFMSVAFLVILGRILGTLSLGPGAGRALGLIVTPLLFVYLHLSLRRVYGQGRWLTLAKTLAIALLYLLVLTVGLLAGLLVIAVTSAPGP